MCVLSSGVIVMTDDCIVAWHATFCMELGHNIPINVL
jgi:hypothetical protein